MQNKVHVILTAQSLLSSEAPASRPPMLFGTAVVAKEACSRQVCDGGQQLSEVASSELSWLVTARGISPDLH